MKGKDLLSEIDSEILEEKKALAKKQIRSARAKVTRKKKALAEAQKALSELMEKPIEDFDEVEISFRAAASSDSPGLPPWLESSEDGENDD